MAIPARVCREVATDTLLDGIEGRERGVGVVAGPWVFDVDGEVGLAGSTLSDAQSESAMSFELFLKDGSGLVAF